MQVTEMRFQLYWNWSKTLDHFTNTNLFSACLKCSTFLLVTAKFCCSRSTLRKQLHLCFDDGVVEELINNVSHTSSHFLIPLHTFSYKILHTFLFFYTLTHSFTHFSFLWRFSCSSAHFLMLLHTLSFFGPLYHSLAHFIILLYIFLMLVFTFSHCSCRLLSLHKYFLIFCTISLF